jgi:proteasome component ECM29
VQIHDYPDYRLRALSVALSGRLEQAQDVFTQLLADAKIKHLPRECCCLGLAACRGIAGSIATVNADGEKASDLFNERVLRAFGQSTKFATSAYIETPAQAEARRAAERRNQGDADMIPVEIEEDVGGAAGLSEAALGAYREMAAASVALGRHDIFFGLLALSVTHSCWQDEERRSRYR